MFWRQLDLCPPDKLKFPITVVGAGATGSSIVYNLAKMGCSDITVMDFDRLEPHNVSNQLCLVGKIGALKVEALGELIKTLTDIEINAVAEKYEAQPLSGVVIAAVDSMDVRMAIWKMVEMNISVPLFLDPRMGGEVGVVYCIKPVDPDHRKLYKENLYPSNEAEDLPCSAQSIIYCPSLMGALVCAFVKKYAVGETPPIEFWCDLPNLRMWKDVKEIAA
jgi:hypothetical protein